MDDVPLGGKLLDLNVIFPNSLLNPCLSLIIFPSTNCCYRLRFETSKMIKAILNKLKSWGPLRVAQNIYEHLVGFSNTFSEQISKWKIESVGGNRENLKHTGRHVLKNDAAGNILCTACMLCVETCPVNCIQIKAGPAKKNNPRICEPLLFNLNSLECIYCGECVDVCPVDAIFLDPSHKLACHSGSVIIWTKEFLQEH